METYSEYLTKHPEEKDRTQRAVNLEWALQTVDALNAEISQKNTETDHKIDELNKKLSGDITPSNLSIDSDNERLYLGKDENGNVVLSLDDKGGESL